MGHFIGEKYGGGIVFHVDKTGEHGLIAASFDQSNGIQWYNGDYIRTGAIETAVGTGLNNTNLIVAIQGAGAYAAAICKNLDLDGYNDWYLPSKDELDLMYENIGNGSFDGGVPPDPLTNIGGLAWRNYWSSSEGPMMDDEDYAWLQFFYDGHQFRRFKANSFHVRAVRIF